MALTTTTPNDFLTVERRSAHSTRMAQELVLQVPLGGSFSESQTRAFETGQTVVELYDRYFDFVWRSLRRLGVRDCELEDAVHDVFLVVHRRLDSFEGRSTIKSWVFGIAIRVAKAYRRRKALQGARSLDEATLTCVSDSPEEVQARFEAAEQVQRLLESMDDDKRVVFVLAELEQIPAPEIAEMLGIPTNTVYSRLRLARATFEEGLKRLRAKDTWRRG